MLAFGRNTVTEALKSNFKVSEVYIQDSIKQDPKISTLLNLASSKHVKVTKMPLKGLDRMLNTEEHQGVGCNVEYHEFKLKEVLEQGAKAFIYISDVTFEQNIGAIIRTAECAGLSGVIIPNDVRITPTVAKISTGALFHIPVIKNSIYQTVKELKSEGFQIVGIERNGRSFAEVNIMENVLLIIGGEDKSLSENLRKDCDEIIELPQFGKVNSLNMSVASGIIIYEYVRQNIGNLTRSAR